MKRRYDQDWRTNELVHRQVVEASLGRKLLKTEHVHHINGDTHDNRLENLMVLSPQEHNILHKQKYPRIKTCVICGKEYAPSGSKRKTSKVCSPECKIALDKANAAKRARPISQFDLGGKLLKTWASATEIQNELGYFGSNICKCCRGDIKSYKGYIWAYA